MSFSCHAPPPVLPGCGRDVDCKGTRICVSGSCVDSAPRVAAPTTTVAPTPPATTPPQEPPPAPPIALPGASPLFHVDRAHTGRSPFRVSTTTPTELARAVTGGTVYASPAVTDEGVAIIGSHDHLVRAVAFDEKKAPAADVRWTRETGDLVWSSAALGPGAGGGVVAYVGSDDDHLYALDTADGHLRWSYRAGPCRRISGPGPEGARCDVDGVTVGPDGTIYFVADGAYGLRPDGTVRFRFALPTHCTGAPAIGPDRTLYFGCQDGRVYALAPDGKRRWEFPTGDDVDGAPAVAADGTIYVGSDDHKFYALTPAGGLRWSVQTGDAIRSSPAIAADGTVYFGSLDGNLYAIQPDGTVAWTFRAADRIVGSPAIDAAGTILFGSEDDRLYALAPDGKLLWSVLLDGDVDSTPAIGPGGVIFVGSDDKAVHILR